MTMNYYLTCLAVNITCLLFSATLFRKLSGNIGSGVEVRFFQRMILMYKIFLLCEIIWVIGEGGFLPLPPFVGSVIKVAGTAFIPAMVYMWFQYAQIIFENAAVHTRKFRILSFIPLGIMLLIYISTPVTGLVAKVLSDGTIVHGPLAGLTCIVDDIYGAAVIIQALFLIARNRNIHKRRLYITHMLFIIICIIGEVIDTAVPGTPILALAITLSYSVLFMTMQESRISSDALTGLNNRSRADKYMRDILEKTDENNPFCLFLIDIDDFRIINERFGYVEGDNALNLVSDSLKTIIGRWGGFLARWGGDEFLVIIRTGDADKIMAFRDELSKTLEKTGRANHHDYELTVSIGREICTDKNRSPAEIIRTAERKLYKVKNSKGLVR